jgi:hypothetical protein
MCMVSQDQFKIAIISTWLHLEDFTGVPNEL